MHLVLGNVFVILIYRSIFDDILDLAKLVPINWEPLSMEYGQDFLLGLIFYS